MKPAPFLPAGAVVAAAALALSPLPPLVRTVLVLPTLVLVAGRAAAELVLGGEENDDDEGDVPEVLAAALPVVLGLLSLLLAVLLLAALSVPIAAVSVALATSGVALVLLLAARLIAPRTRRTPGPVSTPGMTAVRSAVRAPETRRVATTAGAVLAIAAAITAAVALVRVPVERYTQIAVTDPAPTAGTPLAARPGAPVSVSWTRRSWAEPLGARVPVVAVTVGDAPAPGLTGTTTAPVADETGERQDGTVRFDAPGPGLWTVRVTVDPAAVAPDVLVLTLQVRP